MGRSVGRLRDEQAVGAILSWAQVWRLTCLRKKKGGGEWNRWMTGDQFRFDMGDQRRGLMSEILSSSAGGNLGIYEWGLGLQSAECLLDAAGFEVIRIGWGNRGPPRNIGASFPR